MSKRESYDGFGVIEQREEHTASCFSLLPRVVRIVVNLDKRVLYCAASVSFSSFVRSSSSRSLCVGSRSERSSASECVAPLSSFVGEEADSLSLSEEERAPFVSGSAGADDITTKNTTDGKLAKRHAQLERGES